MVAFLAGGGVDVVGAKLGVFCGWLWGCFGVVGVGAGDDDVGVFVDDFGCWFCL